jgi:hypothetical protein
MNKYLKICKNNDNAKLFSNTLILISNDGKKKKYHRLK